MSEDGKIKCEIDGAMVHSIQKYLKETYPDVSIEDYREKYPNAPLLSELAKDAIQRRKAQRTAQEVANSADRKPLTELFGFPADKVTTASGTIMTAAVIDRGKLSAEDQAFIPEIDNDFIFNIDLTKIAIIALELNKPGLFWGLHGTGKTSIWEQVCARTGRPFQRVQHTINTEESHVLGQYIVSQEIKTDKDGKEHIHPVTKFNLGPLPIAMIHGHTYCADEYDFALPAVTSVYQPVLEGKSLIIKDAPPEYRVIRPHPNFRFVATGNTNGGGDETGLYQGTQIQNAANYSRFGVTAEVDYLDAKVEAAIIAGKSGIRMNEASKLVQYAKSVRDQFRAGNIGATISPRELINAAVLGVVTGSNWRKGLELAFINRLSRVDKETLEQFAQRIFG